MYKKYIILILVLLTGCSHTIEQNTQNNTFEINSQQFYNTTCIIYREMEVRGNSMEPMFKNGDNLTLMQGYYDCNPVLRGDIIAFNDTSRDTPIIKRVMVFDNDSIEFVQYDNYSSLMMVNGLALANSQDKPYKFSERQKSKMLVFIKNDSLIANSYLIFGDNGGKDSRSFGAVGKNGFIGKFEKIIE